MFVVKMILLGVGIAAVVVVCIRGYAARRPGWWLFGSLLPLSLIASAALVVASQGT